jgi:type VI protein secretion system component Hcp
LNARLVLKPLSTAVLVTALLFLSAGDALAQQAFLFVPNIPGDSTTEGYENWINVLSIRQSATASTRKSVACDVSLVKRIDVSGPALWATAASGALLPEVRIAVLRNAAAEGSGGSTNSMLYDIKLENVRVAAVQATAGTSDSSETVTFGPQRATLTFYTQTATGLPGPSVVQSFDCQ